LRAVCRRKVGRSAVRAGKPTCGPIRSAKRARRESAGKDRRNSPGADHAFNHLRATDHLRDQALPDERGRRQHGKTGHDHRNPRARAFPKRTKTRTRKTFEAERPGLVGVPPASRHAVVGRNADGAAVIDDRIGGSPVGVGPKIRPKPDAPACWRRGGQRKISRPNDVLLL